MFSLTIKTQLFNSGLEYICVLTYGPGTGEGNMSGDPNTHTTSLFLFCDVWAQFVSIQSLR